MGKKHFINMGCDTACEETVDAANGEGASKRERIAEGSAFLRCPAQQYAWGKIGDTSVVGQLKQSDPKFELAADKPYAEYWMGTHCNGPAEVEGAEVPLTQLLKENPDMMSSYPAAYESYKATGELPYLFKILSVEKALSIQAHPDKALAERIHASHPTIYKDPNHKPEMALAITEMEALCQFRDPAEISEFLASEPEFASMCGEAEVAAFEADKSSSTLKGLFECFMNKDEATVKANLDTLLERYKSVDDKTDTQALVVRLNEQFPGDIGCFCPFLLNYVKLQPGEAVFLAANEPHAYLSGDLAECMACSDNVIRSGLTPKFKDVALLVECLTYNTGRAPIEHGTPLDNHTRRFTPPIPEFEMFITGLKGGESYKTAANATPMLTVVIAASDATMQTVGQPEPVPLVAGQVLFTPPGVSIDLVCAAAGSVQLYSARCNETTGASL